jgi:hypothetical protein
MPGRGASKTSGYLLYERMFVTSRGHPHAEFQRALDRGNIWVAEAVAREMPHLSLEDALRLVHLYAARDSPKYERAAMRWLERYLAESSPRLKDFAKVAATLANAHEPDSSPNVD